MYKDKLIKFLNKKGFNDIKIGNDNIDIFYTKHNFKVTIRLHIYNNNIIYESPECQLKYQNTGSYKTYYRKASWNRRGGDVYRYVGGDNINRLKTNINRKDLNGAVYKNILRIISWIEPVLDERKKKDEDLNDYTSEIKFYFEDKYGKEKIKIDIYDSSSKSSKNITVTIDKKQGIEKQKIKYKNGEYFLMNIDRYFYENFIYKQRIKKPYI